MGKKLRAESVNVIFEKRCLKSTPTKYSFCMDDDVIEI